ncbi:MAG TPA: AMP-binding protein [Candidatus Acidoferrales bacterium]|nr:AMP-binding protein [Candidatus Acidoferrales bacterium]
MAEALSFDAGTFTVGAHIEARATHPVAANKVFLMQHERSWTYRQFRDESVRTAHLFLRRLGNIDDAKPGHVAMIMENHLELLSIYGGCAYGGLTLFGVNTGLRGEVLSGVLNQSRARVLVVDERFLSEVERVRSDLKHIAPENILVLRTQGGSVPANSDLAACLDREVGPASKSMDAPSVDVMPTTNLMVIYTSGTTGLPKGINNNHMKLCAVGMVVSSNMGLGQDAVGYGCMPLFHSNSMFVGLMPAFWVGGSMGLRERFSASQFVPDVLKYGVTYWNYVGEPVHYVLAAIEKQYDGDEARIAAEVTNNPKNHMRYACGNGAAPPDIDKFVKWLGLEDMFELYGSTEAAISTFRRKGDPRGSVGEVTDAAVKILGPDGKECEPAQLGADGKLLNYDRCVGEICRVADDTSLFQGYFDNAKANSEKYRDGIYHSGDLGHILVQEGKRFLYFDGRTDDWIRKDGENFSAGQVGRIISEHDDIALAVAYGVPCAVSDELVMAALKMRDGATFDPKAFFDWCEAQVTGASMDRKWFPDFVTIVDDFEYTQTQKVLVRNYKKVHFDLKRQAPGTKIYWRERGDKSFKPLTASDYERLRKEFAEREKLDLLDR